MTPPKPQAYLIALNGVPSLHKRFTALERELHRRNATLSLAGFVSVLNDRRCSVNMSLESLVRVLKVGKWLNIYEAISHTSKLTGDDLETAVKAKIPKWYWQRKKFEEILQFGMNTHYASMNLGGPGPVRYGPCCVVLNVKKLGEYITCFGGDSLRACFDAQGKQVLVDSQIRSLFTIERSLPQMAAVRHRAYIRSAGPMISPTELRGVLEASDALIEIYIHGDVLASSIDHVAMTKQEYCHLWELTRRHHCERGKSRERQEYDRVKPFKELLSLLKKRTIPIISTDH